MQYYYLIAGLPEFPFDPAIAASSGNKFNVREARDTIKAELSPADQRAVELLYLYYDIVNILNYIKQSNLPFSPLGNLSPEGVARVVDGHVADETQDESPIEVELTTFPQSLWTLVDHFKQRFGEEPGDPDDVPAEVAEDELETRMYAIFYDECEKSKSEYLRRWTDTDRMIRNITAAYRAKAMKWPAEAVEKMIVDQTELKAQLVGSQSADFGLKGEFPYMDELMAVLETPDFVERERRMDSLRWDISDDLAEHDYFGIGRILSYLIHLNILYRWVALDPKHGRESFRQMVETLTELEKIRQMGTDPAAQQEETPAPKE